FWSHGNPVDVLGDAPADRYAKALEIVIKDDGVDAVLVILTPQAMTEVVETAKSICEVAKHTDKPVLACFMGEATVNVGIDILARCGVPNYPFPERAALSFKAMSDYRHIQTRPLSEYKKFEVDNTAVKAVFERVRSEGRLSIGDAEARAILQAYGLKTPESLVAANPKEAVEMANQIGYPVVLKIASPDILHKTDVGGVKVGLSNAEELRDAFELMVYRAERYVPEARIWGCQVQEMAPPGGLEILVGMNRDPQFGPLVTFGLGGIYVEVLKDVTFRIAPFTIRDAEMMLKEIRTHALLDGVRGQPPADKAAIVETLLKIGQLVQEFPEITELDINPLIAYSEGQGAIAIDMRLVLSK
ncbi:MAG: acetate--CoA ligase family protein, partial [Anaerolineales bacterium]|nr:acetate--CoA ligase family protein [Anaerolineales bacterium]